LLLDQITSLSFIFFSKLMFLSLLDYPIPVPALWSWKTSEAPKRSQVTYPSSKFPLSTGSLGKILKPSFKKIVQNVDLKPE
jgi:hypothetical protein